MCGVLPRTLEEQAEFTGSRLRLCFSILWSVSVRFKHPEKNFRMSCGLLFMWLVVVVVVVLQIDRHLVPKPPLKILNTGFLKIPIRLQDGSHFFLNNAINVEVRRLRMCDYSNIFSFLFTHRHKQPHTCIINKGGLSKWEKYKCQMVKRKTWRNIVFLLQDCKYETGRYQ